ncbi:hypothetical protein PHISP_07574 [Aspergillus sp. HF37]|nr:hypothetical protein PHISP_07574 [Aspergillus sp. HF37]
MPSSEWRSSFLRKRDSWNRALVAKYAADEKALSMFRAESRVSGFANRAIQRLSSPLFPDVRNAGGLRGYVFGEAIVLDCRDALGEEGLSDAEETHGCCV